MGSDGGLALALVILLALVCYVVTLDLACRGGL